MNELELKELGKGLYSTIKKKYPNIDFPPIRNIGFRKLDPLKDDFGGGMIYLTLCSNGRIYGEIAIDITLDKECIYGLLIHEICHMVQRNHCKSFFKLNERICKDLLGG